MRRRRKKRKMMKRKMRKMKRKNLKKNKKNEKVSSLAFFFKILNLFHFELQKKIQIFYFAIKGLINKLLILTLYKSN